MAAVTDPAQPSGRTQAWRPERHAYKAWSFEPVICSSGNSLSTGRLWTVGLEFLEPATISNIIVNCSTLGSGFTSLFAGWHTNDGTLRAVTADRQADFGATGIKIMPLLNTWDMDAGSWGWASFLCVATTPPQLSRGPNAVYNPGLTAATMRFGLHLTSSLTAIASFTPGTNISGTITAGSPMWVAVS